MVPRLHVDNDSRRRGRNDVRLRGGRRELRGRSATVRRRRRADGENTVAEPTGCFIPSDTSGRRTGICGFGQGQFGPRSRRGDRGASVVVRHRREPRFEPLPLRRILYVSQRGILYALSAADGTKRWEKSWGQTSIYVETVTERNVYCLSKATLGVRPRRRERALVRHRWKRDGYGRRTRVRVARHPPCHRRGRRDDRLAVRRRDSRQYGPVAADGAVFGKNRQGSVYSITTDGTERWTFETDVPDNYTPSHWTSATDSSTPCSGKPSTCSPPRTVRWSGRSPVRVGRSTPSSRTTTSSWGRRRPVRVRPPPLASLHGRRRHERLLLVGSGDGAFGRRPRHGGVRGLPTVQ